jgi:hypothetical protein
MRIGGQCKAEGKRWTPVSGIRYPVSGVRCPADGRRQTADGRRQTACMMPFLEERP